MKSPVVADLRGESPEAAVDRLRDQLKSVPPGSRIAVGVPRSAVLVLPGTGHVSIDRRGIALKALPSIYRAAPVAVVRSGSGTDDVVVLSPLFWSACVRVLNDATINNFAAVYASGPDIAADIRSGTIVWLVPFRPPLWRRVAWGPDIERVSAVAAALLVAASAGVEHARQDTHDRRRSAQRRSDDIAKADRRAPVSMDFLLDSLTRSLPSRVYIMNIVVDGTRREASIRGHAADYSLVSSFADSLSATPGVAKCVQERLAAVRMGNAHVVEFSMKVTLA